MITIYGNSIHGTRHHSSPLNCSKWIVSRSGHFTTTLPSFCLKWRPCAVWDQLWWRGSVARWWALFVEITNLCCWCDAVSALIFGFTAVPHVVLDGSIMVRYLRLLIVLFCNWELCGFCVSIPWCCLVISTSTSAVFVFKILQVAEKPFEASGVHTCTLDDNRHLHRPPQFCFWSLRPSFQPIIFLKFFLLFFLILSLRFELFSCTNLLLPSPRSVRCLPAISIAGRLTLQHHRLSNSGCMLPGDAQCDVLGTWMRMLCGVRLEVSAKYLRDACCRRSPFGNNESSELVRYSELRFNNCGFG